MTLKGSRTVKNMVVIGGTVSTVAFGFSMVSSKASMSKIHNLSYSTDKVGKNITTISNFDQIEDFEFANGCKFLFYKKGDKDAFKNGEVKGARSFSSGENNNQEEIIKKVQDNKQNCTKDRFIYSEI
ncbi:hypothetical protein A6V39_00955 [Candidatus Mycoplasma haematobovis]|uniref:Uncharacterized protein n=1 Tax=Candidatus Mycoplasma haematobovis TaxID=432608 RepID=A0A1A9QF34_9MOLU|nr:hypothetical protein [Candidatus Mycoplasma haematobovis]OAL10621.1 hypothetical protein A6V39_00955 [Candidatus Mycoplasma haematobovis]